MSPWRVPGIRGGGEVGPVIAVKRLVAGLRPRMAKHRNDWIRSDSRGRLSTPDERFPKSRAGSMVAEIGVDEARARGYIWEHAERTLEKPPEVLFIARGAPGAVGRHAIAPRLQRPDELAAAIGQAKHPG